MKPLQERDKVAHLLRRFGLGASESEVDHYSKNGLKGAIDLLLDYESQPDDFPIQLQDLANDNGNINVPAAQSHWYMRLLTTRRPLEQKLTIFWHDHFATSAAKVDVAVTMHNHIETIRRNATGKFSELLSAVSKDPAMIYWLDGQDNKKGTPNENFAREVMELFTMGVDNGYTEEDIQEAARAFTGWTFGAGQGQRFRQTQKPFRNAKFFSVDRVHDNGMKRVLGREGRFDGNDVLDILCNEPATAREITRKMWEWFAYPEPSASLVNRIATTWRKSELDIKVLVRSIMESDEFYSEKCMRALIKNPIDFCVGTMRGLGVGYRILTQFENAQDARQQRRLGLYGRLVAQRTKGMGMELMFPPGVDGWVNHDAWISSATMVERIKLADFLFGNQARNANQVSQSLIGNGVRPEVLVNRMLSLMDAELPDETVGKLVAISETASGGRVTRQNVRGVMNEIARPMFGTPEFQFA